MSNADQAPEPSMDEILASIRRIISDEPTGTGGSAENKVANDIAKALNQEQAPAQGMAADSIDDDILDLTEVASKQGQAGPQTPPQQMPPQAGMNMAQGNMAQGNMTQGQMPAGHQAQGQNIQSPNMPNQNMPNSQMPPMANQGFQNGAPNGAVQDPMAGQMQARQAGHPQMAPEMSNQALGPVAEQLGQEIQQSLQQQPPMGGGIDPSMQQRPNMGQSQMPSGQGAAGHMLPTGEFVPQQPPHAGVQDPNQVMKQEPPQAQQFQNPGMETGTAMGQSQANEMPAQMEMPSAMEQVLEMGNAELAPEIATEQSQQGLPQDQHESQVNTLGSADLALGEDFSQASKALESALAKDMFGSGDDTPTDQGNVQQESDNGLSNEAVETALDLVGNQEKTPVVENQEEQDLQDTPLELENSEVEQIKDDTAGQDEEKDMSVMQENAQVESVEAFANKDVEAMKEAVTEVMAGDTDENAATLQNVVDAKATDLEADEQIQKEIADALAKEGVEVRKDNVSSSVGQQAPKNLDETLSAAVSQVTAAANEAVSGQSKASAGGTETPFEQGIKEMLRPMLKDWLDQNMPRLVEGAMKDTKNIKSDE